MLLSLFLLTASAADLDPAVLQYGFCVHCHGAHGEGRPELDAPRIGDLSPDYIATQLQAFRDGHRDGQTPRGNGHPKTGFPDDAALQVVAGFVTLTMLFQGPTRPEEHAPPGCATQAPETSRPSAQSPGPSRNGIIGTRGGAPVS